MKKVVVIGASGVIGSAVVTKLANQCEVIKVARSSQDYNVDMTNNDSIAKLFTDIGTFDALVVAAGDVAFADFTAMTDEQWQVGLNSKLMGQINLTRKAVEYLTDGGSITLTSGVLTDHFIAWGTSASTINGAVNHFVKAVATELPRGLRINAVSPTVLTESLGVYGDYFPGFESVSAEKVANAFYKSVMGVQTGSVFELFDN